MAKEELLKYIRDADIFDPGKIELYTGLEPGHYRMLFVDGVNFQKINYSKLPGSSKNWESIHNKALLLKNIHGKGKFC
jgi:hypothetical protein